LGVSNCTRPTSTVTPAEVFTHTRHAANATSTDTPRRRSSSPLSIRYAKAKLFFPASVAPEQSVTENTRETTERRRTFCHTPHLLIGDSAELVDEVAVESALAAVHVAAHHNAHVGFGSSSIIKRQIFQRIHTPLPVKNIECACCSCCPLFASHFGAVRGG
jgi:hypothetical protein